MPTHPMRQSGQLYELDRNPTMLGCLRWYPWSQGGRQSHLCSSAPCLVRQLITHRNGRETIAAQPFL